jgi:hypothetical protein
MNKMGLNKNEFLCVQIKANYNLALISVDI